MRTMVLARHSPVLALLALVLVLAGCATPGPLPVLRPGSGDGLLLIIHGSGDSADGWPLELERAIVDAHGRQPGWDIRRLEWGALAEDRLAAPARGREVGAELAQQLTAAAGYRVVHLVAHSVGAHVAHGFTRRYRELRPDEGTVIHQTYLDPFTPRGALVWRFGEDVFGTHADFAESFVTITDPAFMTNEYLDHAYNINVDATLPASDGVDAPSAHDWPVRFYIRAVASGARWFAHAPYHYPQLLASAEARTAYYARLRREMGAGGVYAVSGVVD